MPREINPWAMYPRKTSTAPLPEALKMEVTTKANDLIETVLKPRYIQPPLENPQFNYIVDIYGKWYRKAFYFSAEFCKRNVDDYEACFETHGGCSYYFSWHRCPVWHEIGIYGTGPSNTLAERRDA